MISALGGDETAREIWRNIMGQYKQSLAENAMYRYKSLAMNQMSQLGTAKR